MDSLEGENYCEILALNLIALDDKIQKVRLDAAKAASRTFEYNDPTATKVVNDGCALESVTISIEGVQVDIPQPELWVKTMRLAIKRFGERYGTDAAATIINRYLKRRDPINVYVKQGISKRSFGDRREKFLKLLLLYAVQNNLLNVS